MSPTFISWTSLWVLLGSWTWLPPPRHGKCHMATQTRWYARSNAASPRLHARVYALIMLQGLSTVTLHGLIHGRGNPGLRFGTHPGRARMPLMQFSLPSIISDSAKEDISNNDMCDGEIQPSPFLTSRRGHFHPSNNFSIARCAASLFSWPHRLVRSSPKWSYSSSSFSSLGA